MKKTTIFFVLLVIIGISAEAALPEIKASILRYDPTPAEQGNPFDIWVQISNSGTAAEKVAVRFVPKYPFSLPEGQEDEILIGTIAATESKVVKFTVLVDPTAPNGERDITFQYRFGSDTTSWAQFESPITIETQDTGIVIEDYQVKPSPIIPGQIIELRMNLRNTGRTTIKNLDVGLE